MSDEKKFRIAAILSSVLVVLCLANAVFQEHFAHELFGYMKRHIYYSRIVSKRGLSLHEGQYWRKYN